MTYRDSLNTIEHAALGPLREEIGAASRRG